MTAPDDAMPKVDDWDWPVYDRMPGPTALRRDRPLTPGEIEEHIVERVAWLEAAAEMLERRHIIAGLAEGRYRDRLAERTLNSRRKTATERQTEGLHHSAVALKARYCAEGLRDALADQIRTERATLDVLRTLAASARAALYDGRV